MSRGYSLICNGINRARAGEKDPTSSLCERLTVSSIAKRFARGSLWNLFGSATARILVLVAMILVARVLGQVSFGELGLIQSTLGMAGLMTGIGLGETATRTSAGIALERLAAAL